MGSPILAIVSKAVFEKQARAGGRGKLLDVGETFATDRYVSESKALSALEGGGSLFLVTVRPEGERLWLVAVLNAPVKEQGAWVSTVNTTPIRDVTNALPHLKLASGKGIQAKAGALGMSLQTPRVLAESDVALLCVKAEDITSTAAPASATTSPAPVAPPTATASTLGSTSLPSTSAAGSGAGVRIVWTEIALRALTPRTAAQANVKRVKVNAPWERLMDLTHWARSQPRCSFVLVQSESPDLDNLSAAFRATYSTTAQTEFLDIMVRLFGAPTALEIASRTPSGNLASRRAMLLATREAREAARAKAAELFASSDLETKTALAFTFFEERAWTAEALKGWEDPNAGAGREFPCDIFIALLDDPDAMRRVLAKRHRFGSMSDVVAQLGERALPVLMDVFRAANDVYDLGHAADALSLFESDEVGHLFLTELGKQQVREPAAAFFNRFPAIALRVLPEVARGKTKIAKFAQEMLGQAERLAKVTTGAEARSGASDEAAIDELPAALTSGPFSGKPGKRSARKVVTEVAVHPPAAKVKWTRLARKSELLAEVAQRRDGREMASEEATQWLANPKTISWTHFSPGTGETTVLPLATALEAFDRYGLTSSHSAASVEHFLALFGERVIPAMVKWVRQARWINASWTAIREVESVEVVSALGTHLESDDEGAWEYVIAHPELALLGLLPVAVGPLGKERDGAEKALRELSARGHRARLEEIARAAGPEVLAALGEVLAHGPAIVDFGKTPKMPAAFRPAAITPPKTKEGGKLLPLAAFEHLGAGLALSFRWRPHPIVRAAREVCDPRSLAELSWDLAKAWVHGGRRKGDLWMLESLIHFADAEVTRRTTPEIKDDAVVAVLGWIPTDDAATELLTILARAANQKAPIYTPRLAEFALARIARLRCLAVEELEDRTVDTLGLDANGELELDLGSRCIRVRVDARLEPFLLDETRARMKAFPSTRKDGDAIKVAAARAKYEEIMEDAAAIFARRRTALAAAMTSRRAWSRDAFTAQWAQHPLQRLLAECVVWETGKAPRTRRFRVAEDGTLADEGDEALTLEDAAEVRVADPSSMSAEEKRRWRDRFAEYEVMLLLGQLE